MSKLSVTSLSQYIRLENCERFLRLRLRPDEEKQLLARWRLTIQPLTPLLQDYGSDFEQDVFKNIAGGGEKVVDLTDKNVDETRRWLREIKTPTILLQPDLEATLGGYALHGRADAIRLERDRKGVLNILVADVKASRKERTEHHVQVAVYARMLEQLARAEGLTVGTLSGAVLHIQEDGTLPTISRETQTFDIQTYFGILDRLFIDADSTVNRIAGQKFEDVAYHLGYKCDGCLYNAICMYDSAERLDLSLVPMMTGVEKRVLHETDITTVPQLAGLMDLPVPKSAKYELTVARGKKDTVANLINRWPVGPNLPMLVQRAKRVMHRFGSAEPSTSYLYGSDFGSLPSTTT